jgi:diguanylate cyclase (GGDEF)-like protein
MLLIPASTDEVRRLAVLRALGLLDTPAEERFDRITRLAIRLFGVPIALISLIDEDRQWFKSRQGLALGETPRIMSFCAHAIEGAGVMQVRDAQDDLRFADNPLVLGDPNIRFYAGCPIAAPDGTKLGTICVIAREPRVLSEADLQVLSDLAQLVEREIALVQMALHDEMTGLSNRRGFIQLATMVLDLCVRHDQPATLVFADLDGLKAVNDRYGHEEGDRAIREAAGLLSRTFRTSDVLGRLGGDEFCAVLTGIISANEPIQRLKSATDERNASDGRYRLSFSVGTAEFDPVAPEPVTELLQRADAAMYRAKQRAHRR